MTDVIRPEEINVRCSIDKEEIECYGCETTDSTCSCVKKHQQPLDGDQNEDKDSGCCGSDGCC